MQIQKEDLSIKLKAELRRKPKDKLVFLCIGTDKVIGDSFGPYVGEKLKEKTKEYQNIEVFGSLENPVHYQNIEQVLEKIDLKESFVIALDAALSNKAQLGKIVLEKKGLILGSGLQKKKERIGNISIKGVVSEDYQVPRLNYLMLQQVSLHFIKKMAEETTKEICKGIL